MCEKFQNFFYCSLPLDNHSSGFIGNNATMNKRGTAFGRDIARSGLRTHHCRTNEGTMGAADSRANEPYALRNATVASCSARQNTPVARTASYFQVVVRNSGKQVMHLVSGDVVRDFVQKAAKCPVNGRQIALTNNKSTHQLVQTPARFSP